MSVASILFRKNYTNEKEHDIASRYMEVHNYRSKIPPNSLVIGRYSVLPFYAELEADLNNNGSILINSHRAHCWISEFQYYDILSEYTPETWWDHNFCYCDYPGPFIVKGETNSRKLQWNTMMYAETKADALEIATKLLNDGLISSQRILYRKFVPLKTFEYGINELPFSEEYRFFFIGSSHVASGYYWSVAENADSVGEPPEGARLFAQKIAAEAAKYTTFFVLDVARTESGDWILIEINDGQMSGLSTINPHDFYKNLANTAIWEQLSVDLVYME